MMDPEDVGKVLAVAAIYDRRTVGKGDIIAWSDALDGLDPRECAEAIRRHYANTDRWLMPSHVRDLVTLAHREDAERRKRERVLHEIEAGKQADRERAHQAFVEARQAVTDAIEAKHARERGEGDEQQEQAS